MQAHYTRLAAIAALAAAMSASNAAAQQAAHDVFVTEAASSIGSASGGVWKTSNGAAAPAAPHEVSNGQDGAQTDGVLIVRHLSGLRGGAQAEAPSDVATAPAEGSTDYLLKIEGVEGESSESARHPIDDGVVVLDSTPPTGSTAARGAGTLTLSNGNGAPAAPAQADAHGQSQEQSQEQPQAPAPQRRRSNFSISIGGVTVGSGGVRVAVGDVDGDGRGAGRQHAPVRPVRVRDPGR
jgi:hypothetical protein